MSKEPKEHLETLLVKDRSTFSANASIAWLGELINVAEQLSDAGALHTAIEVGRDLLAGSLDDLQRVHVLYFLGNAYNALRQSHGKTSPEIRRLKVPEAEQELLLLRQAARLAAIGDLPSTVRCRVLTNLGNVQSFLGRPIEAIEHYDCALSADPNFQMARGNKGFCLLHYGRALAEPGQRHCLIKTAYDEMKEALAGDLEDHARAGFLQTIQECDRRFPPGYIERGHPMRPVSLGRSKQEQSYRQWCLRNRLFLSPLNDLGAITSAARDSLTLPAITMPLGEGPFFHGRFNQLKQEYASARYLFFDGLRQPCLHFSDRGVDLANTMIYPAYGLSVEKMRFSFRAGYSVLDKIAVFLNSYLNLGAPQNRVDFSNLWYEGCKRADIRQTLGHAENWPLRGLFWLSRDLYETEAGGDAPLDPQTRSINSARNHLEHKYLVLVDMKIPTARSEDFKRSLYDPEALCLTRSEFQDLTLHLFKIVRSCLIYLCMAIAWEERTRKKNHTAGKIVPAIHLDHYEDNWKR